MMIAIVLGISGALLLGYYAFRLIDWRFLQNIPTPVKIIAALTVLWLVPAFLYSNWDGIHLSSSHRVFVMSLIFATLLSAPTALGVGLYSENKR